MRSAKGSDNFPYHSAIVCYIGVSNAGEIMQIDHDFDAISLAYNDAIDGKIRIFAVWPGNYRSDLFEIDDLDAFADGFGVRSLKEHEHKVAWSLSSHDDKKSLYANVNVILECGCIVTRHNIKRFAKDMSDQKGWDIATSKGLSYHTDGLRTEYSFRIRRNSL